MVQLLAHRAVDAAGLAVEIGRGFGERSDGSNTFTALLPLILILQPHPQLLCQRN
jgi:hypothetical protein